jgi:hypothetical protein
MQRHAVFGGVLFVLVSVGCPGDGGTVTSATTGSTSVDPTGDPGGDSATMPTGVTTTDAAPTTGSATTMAATVTDATTTTTTTTTATTDDSTDTADTGTTPGATTDVMMNCSDAPPLPAGPEVVIAPEFAEFYKTYELGQVPGIPQSSRLGGCVISHQDPNVLLVAGESEDPTGKIYAIQVVRGDCNHIVGFTGMASVVANTPYVDANLAYLESGLLFYTAWPVNQISQLLPNTMVPAVTTDMNALGVENSVSGIGFVPPSFADPGGMRVLTWSGGKWYHLDRTPNGETFNLGNAQQTAVLPNGPGGFAYIPSGSPGFTVDHLIVSEWSTDTVGVYEVDEQGDPLPATRKDFFTKFPRPWGAYFEPLTGDFIFLTWGAGMDRVYIVQGFEPPPPLPQ